MSIFRIQEYKYHIIYFNDKGTYSAYKRMNSGDWQIYRNGNWQSISKGERDKKEKEFKDHTK
jgi:hypothetical protein